MAPCSVEVKKKIVLEKGSLINQPSFANKRPPVTLKPIEAARHKQSSKYFKYRDIL